MSSIATKWPVLIISASLLIVVAIMGRLAGGAGGATQFNITLQFDQTGDAVDPCEAPHPPCGRDLDLALVMNAAALHWESIIEDSHEILIRYRWADVSDPVANIVETDANGRPTEALIRFPVTANYFYDSTPLDDEEFDMRVRLYRTVHPQEQGEAFQGDEPLEIFEASYNGLELDDDQKQDVLSFALHEMGHAVGLAQDVLDARPEPACTEDDPWYDLDPALTGGPDFELRAFIGEDCSHLDLGGITACKPPPGDQDTTSSEPSTLPPLTIAECTAHQALFWFAEYPNSRFRPGIADILAVATAAGWEEINLPRKYSLAGTDGLWFAGETWLGDRIPDADDDVYIVNQEAHVEINSFEEGGVARNLTITDGNILNVFSFEFAVDDHITLEGDGTRLSVDLGATVHGFDTVIGLGSLLDVPVGGTFDSFHIRNFGEIRGADSNVDVVVLINNGTIRGNGGLLSFTSSNIDAPFDLDGFSAGSHIQALVGDLSFDGEITDEVLADIRIGPGHFITFADGWTQQGSISPGHLLTMTGGDFEATINGQSTLNGLLVVNQLARFSSNVEIGNVARVNMSVGGLDPGSGHDQLNIDGDAELSGELIVELLPAFAANPNDRYTLLTYASHTGEFLTETLPALDGGLTFLLDYGVTQMDLVVGFAGADPGAPNCTGQAAANQAQEHGGMKEAAAFHGYDSVKAFQDAIDEFCEG